MNTILIVLAIFYIIFSIGYIYVSATNGESIKYWNITNKIALLIIIILAPIIYPYIIGRIKGAKRLYKEINKDL